MKTFIPSDFAEKDAVRPAPPRKRHRSLFLSDAHLGARGCRADRLLDFLQRNDADTIYLVGDFIDSWRPIWSKWPPEHGQVIRVLVARAQAGVRIVCVPGNHDAFLRRHYGIYFDRIEVVERTMHTAADGKRYLVVHGDACDYYANRLRWLARMGGVADASLRWVGAAINSLRRCLSLDETRTIEDALARINRVIRSGNKFEHRLSALASRHGADGIVCGHFHRTALHDDFGIIYANCGDWLESCTAIAEGADGRLGVIDWRERRAGRAPAPQSEVEDIAELAV